MFRVENLSPFSGRKFSACFLFAFIYVLEKNRSLTKINVGARLSFCGIFYS